MIKLPPLTLALCVVVAPASAQTLNSNRLGSTTYYSGKTSSGKPVTGSSRKLGSTTYSEFRSGGQQTRCTTQRLGSRSYTNCR